MGSTSADKHRSRYIAFRKHFFLSIGLIFAIPFALAEPEQTKWACEADANGQWACKDFMPTGPSYQRPEHKEKNRQASPEDPRIRLTRNLDWVDEEQLSEDEKLLMRDNCCGAYIEPERDYPDSELKPSEASLRLSATSTEAQDNIATLEGDIQISQGYRQVRSNTAIVDQERRTVQLSGNINFREPGILLTGDHAQINMDSGEVSFENAVFVFHKPGVRGTAEKLTRKENNVIYIDNATYTTCEPGNNTWQLKASTVDIDTTRSITTARNVRLEIKDWPVLYIPWLRYPAANNRATGLLFPHVATGNDNGIDFAQPIYLNLAPNYDATITPRYIQERGAMVETEFRHLSRIMETRLSGAYLGSDDGGDTTRENTSAGNKLPHEGEDRWVLNVDHKGGFGHRWTTRIDYTDVSDNDYFRDLDNATLEINSRSHLNQKLALGYKLNHWALSIKGQEFETIIDDGLEQYKQLPRIEANGQYRFDSANLLFTLKQHYVIFDHSEDKQIGSGTFLTRDNQNTTITGSRLRTDYALTWDKQWLWGFFRPSAMIKYMAYDLDNPLKNQTDDSPDAMVPVAIIDTGLYFERETQWFKGYTQTLEPRLYYLNSDFDDQSAIPNFDTSELTFSYQQLFRNDRFSGGDRIGDTEQVTFGITTRLIDTNTGIERIRASLGQIFYLDERQITLNSLDTTELLRDESDIAAELSASLWDHWRFQSDILVNEEAGIINKGSVSLRYNNRDNTVFNLAYRYTRRDSIIPLSGSVIDTDIDQIDTSFALPISDNWNILGRYNQDLNTNQELEIFAGLEYSSCCWRTSIVARRWVDRDDNLILGSEDLDHQSGIFFQIQFKGLAGTGTRIDNILREGIHGYQPPEI